jgi:hypothetical protein
MRFVTSLPALEPIVLEMVLQNEPCTAACVAATVSVGGTGLGFKV